MTLLDRIQSPADLKGLSRDDLRTLSQEIRERLIDDGPGRGREQDRGSDGHAEG